MSEIRYGGGGYLIVLRQPEAKPSGSRIAVENCDIDLIGPTLAFSEHHHITNHVKAATAITKQSFPFRKKLEVRVENDPEEQGEWIVIEVTAQGELERFLNAYNRCAENWVSQIDSEALGMIRLSYSLS